MGVAMAGKASFWQNMNLSVKFSITFGVAIVLFLLSIAMFKISANQTETGYQNLLSREIVISNLSSNISTSLALCRYDAKIFLASGDRNSLDSFQKNSSALTTSAGRIADLADEEVNKIQALAKQIGELQSEYKRIFNLTVQSAERIGFDESQGLHHEFHQAATELELMAGRYELSEFFFSVLELMHSVDLFFNIPTPKHQTKVEKDIGHVTRVLTSGKMDKDTKDTIGFRLEEYTKWIKESFGADQDMVDIIKDQIGTYKKSLMDEITSFYVPQAQVATLEIRRAEKEYLIKLGNDYAEATNLRVKTLQQVFEESTIPVQKKDAVNEVIKKYQDFFATFHQENEQIAEHREKMRDIVRQIEPMVQQIADQAAQLTTSKIRSTQLATQKINRIALFASIAVILLIIVFSYITVRSITTPLKKTISLAGKMAKGDLTGKLEVHQKDEVGDLASALNHMLVNLRDIIGNIATNTDTLTSSSSDLTTISQEMRTGADTTTTKATQLAKGSENMSNNMNSVATASEEASTNLSMVASAIEEMNSTINEIAENSSKAKMIAEKAVGRGDKAATRIKELGNAAQDISAVAETITEISEQTNLLALNATIEAARAGEAGKGFAVVADEIKQLARQTANATTEIKSKITGVQDTSKKTAEELNYIIDIIHQINDISLLLATAVEEQSATTREIVENISQASTGIDEVNRNININANVAHTISEDVTSISVEADGLSATANKVNTSANSLADIGGKLEALVTGFKL